MSVNNDFRRVKIYPTVDDINGKNVSNLSQNLIGESYESSDHYFKTQFNLLREESVRPLVEAIDKLKQILAEEKDDNKKMDSNNVSKEDRKRKLREKIEEKVETNVYFDIRLTESEFIELDYNFGSVLKFTFDYKPLENIDLIDCQNLMNGGILCLSSDNFEKSIIFGIIVKSQLREKDSETKQRLWNFCLKFDFDNNSSKNFNQFILRPKTTYTGVESPSYFEGFRHSLNKLQLMSENFPLNQYIVKLPKDHSIRAPPYLTDETIYDMSCIRAKNLEEVTESNKKPNPLSSVNLMKNDVFGDQRVYNNGIKQLKELSTFDTRQFDGFYAALTKELCVIEGPPGTGKTFVGLKIVECLLNNIKIWNQSSEVRPILIVCYKNHALDQFLEGIIKFNQNVVRIGGKSESKELEDYKLGRIEDKFHEDLELQKQLKIKTDEDMKDMTTNDIKLLDPKLKYKFKKTTKLRLRIRAINKSIIELNEVIQQSFQKILDFDEMEPFIKPKSWIYYFCRSQDSLSNWLNTEQDINFLNNCQKKLYKKLPIEAFDDISTLVKKNVLELKAEERWLLYLHWRQQLLNTFEKQIKTKLQTISEELEKLRLKKVEFHRMLCKGAQVIGLTVTGAAKYTDLVEKFNPKIMIVEEAAEVLEGHVVSALSSTIEHLILIGDHKQLRPLTNVRSLTDVYNLDVSLFERLVKNKWSFIQLELQHRMRPSISELLKVGNIYDNLRNGERVKSYPDIKFTFEKNVYFLDHQHIEDNKFVRDVKDKSRSNLHEAKLVVELVKYFLLHNYPEDQITVLATYNAQLSLIRRLMFEQKEIFVKEVEVDEKPVLNKKFKAIKSMDQNLKEWDDMNGFQSPKKEIIEELKVRVSSVDGFQGEENNIIIISFVRSSKRDVIGFLGNKNRVNVALSRAKHALYCIGNFTIMAKEEKTQMWAKIVEHLSEKQCFGEEFVIGCKCTEEQSISMAGQLELLNLQIKNGLCKCQKQN